MGIKEYIQERKQERKERKVERGVRQRMAKTAYAAEREKQEVKTAAYKAQAEGERKRKSIKQSGGGGFGAFQSYAKGYARSVGTKGKTDDYWGSSSFSQPKAATKKVRKKRRSTSKSRRSTSKSSGGKSITIRVR